MYVCMYQNISRALVDSRNFLFSLMNTTSITILQIHSDFNKKSLVLFHNLCEQRPSCINSHRDAERKHSVFVQIIRQKMNDELTCPPLPLMKFLNENIFEVTSHNEKLPHLPMLRLFCHFS